MTVGINDPEDRGWSNYVEIRPVLIRRIKERRIRELHVPEPGPYDNVVCKACSHMDIDVDFYVDYPCSFIVDLDGEQA